MSIVSTNSYKAAGSQDYETSLVTISVVTLRKGSKVLWDSAVKNKPIYFSTSLCNINTYSTC